MTWQTGHPPRDGKYIVYAPSSEPASPLIAIAWWSGPNRRWELTYWGDFITHWMPLPAPPKEIA